MTRPLALVTGGARRLGAAIATQLALAGFDLAISSHGDGTIDSQLQITADNAGSAIQHFSADLSEPEQAEALMAAVTLHYGYAPNILVNNAAIFGQDGWQDMSYQTLDAHFRINLFSPLLLAQALVKAADKNLQPAIINISDQRVINPNGDQISYTLSKQALAASVRSMAAALAPYARVNAVAPGLVIPTDDYTDAQMLRLHSNMPLGALPDPDGIAQAVLYLARAKHVTGQIIYVDGGAHLKSFDRDFMHM